MDFGINLETLRHWKPFWNCLLVQTMLYQVLAANILVVAAFEEYRMQHPTSSVSLGSDE